MDGDAILGSGAERQTGMADPQRRLYAQDMHFECSEFDLVEAQRFGAVWQHVFEVSTGPVESPLPVPVHRE